MSYGEDNSTESNQLRYTLLCEKFEEYFKMKGYKKDSFFDHRVWFLKNDQTFQSLLHNSTPYPNYEKSNKLLEILSEINKGNDLRNLYISTEEFINKISKTLNDANISKKISNNYIEKNKILEKITKINELLNMLTNRIEKKKKGNYTSKLYTYIISMNNFPSGPYRLTLNINTSFDQENYNELNDNEKLNLDKNNPENVFEIFQEVTLSTKNLINIPKGKDNIVFLSNFSNSQNENESENKFEDYEFSSLDKELKNYLVDRRNSGTTFSNFKLKISGTDGFYESNNEYLLHILLSSIDELCDLSKNPLTKNIALKLNNENDYDKKNDKIVLIELNLELDNLTRMKLLNRMKELYSVTLDNKIKNEMLIDEILSIYFSEIKDSVINILSKEDESRESCCACFIF